MKTKITLPEAYAIISSAAAVTVCGVVVHPCLAPLTGEDENEFMYGEYNDDDYQTFVYKFCEGDNAEVLMDEENGTLTLTDNEGDEVEIGILIQKILR